MDMYMDMYILYMNLYIYIKSPLSIYIYIKSPPSHGGILPQAIQK